VNRTSGGDDAASGSSLDREATSAKPERDAADSAPKRTDRSATRRRSDASTTLQLGERATLPADSPVPSADRMNVIAAGLTDPGLQREHNEDSFCILPEYDLFVVADGMGGHRAGDVASKMATGAIASFFKASSSEDATWPFHFDPKRSVEENRLMTGIKLANRKIYEASARHPEVHGMGTTVVGLVVSTDRSRAYVAHVGDSRCYRVRQGSIELLTEDHSLVNDYLRFMPDMTQEQKDELPRNVITRALGMQDSVEIDVQPTEPQVGDLYVLCSDGLSGMIEDDDILRVVTEAGRDVESAARELVRLANGEGGEDNITVVVLALTDE